jgi:tRNA pseudouridine55 synthase
MDTEKRYTAQIALGAMTDTDDSLGEIVDEASVPQLDPSDIEAALSRFQGALRQTPPVYSAIKSDGEPLYKKARRGEPVNPAPREVVIHQIRLVGFSNNEIDIDVRCGKGTYIRALARDLGRALGTLGHLSALRRLETSGFSVEDALLLDHVDAAASGGSLGSRVIGLKDAFKTMPKAELSLQAQQYICNGRALPIEEVSAPADIAADQHLALIGADGALCAIAKIADNQIRPVRVFK